MFLHKLLTIFVCIFAMDSVAKAMISISRKANAGKLNRKVAKVTLLALVVLLFLVVYEDANLLSVMNIV